MTPTSTYPSGRERGREREGVCVGERGRELTFYPCAEPVWASQGMSRPPRAKCKAELFGNWFDFTFQMTLRQCNLPHWSSLDKHHCVCSVPTLLSPTVLLWIATRMLQQQQVVSGVDLQGTRVSVRSPSQKALFSSRSSTSCSPCLPARGCTCGSHAPSGSIKAGRVPPDGREQKWRCQFFFSLSLSFSPPCIFFMVHYNTQRLILPIIETIFRPIDAKFHSPPITATFCAFCRGWYVVLDAVMCPRSGGARNALSAETDSPDGGNKIYSSILRCKGWYNSIKGLIKRQTLLFNGCALPPLLSWLQFQKKYSAQLAR